MSLWSYPDSSIVLRPRPTPVCFHCARARGGGRGKWVRISSWRIHPGGDRRVFDAYNDCECWLVGAPYAPLVEGPIRPGCAVYVGIEDDSGLAADRLSIATSGDTSTARSTLPIPRRMQLFPARIGVPGAMTLATVPRRKSKRYLVAVLVLAGLIVVLYPDYLQNVQLPRRVQMARAEVAQLKALLRNDTR